MKLTAVGAFGLVVASAVARGEDVAVEGTVCRASRGAGRLIVAAGGVRRPVLVESSATVTFEGDPYEAGDIRPGDKVAVAGERAESGLVTAARLDVKVRVGDAIADALLGVKPPLVGRFAVREAKTAFFSVNLPGSDYVRVDARRWGFGAVGKLRSGDLVELSGKWTGERSFEASGGRILTDQEHGGCRRDARHGETQEQTAAREAAEQRFLDGGDIEG